MWADMRKATNRYILKTANILDRVQRASVTTARKTAMAIVRGKYEEWEEAGETEELPDMIVLDMKPRTPEKTTSDREWNRHGEMQTETEII